MINQNYKHWLNERSIADKEIEKRETLYKNITDYKKVSNHIQNTILELRNNITDISEVIFDDFDNDNQYLTTKIDEYEPEIDYLIKEIKKILRVSKNTVMYNKYFSLIYPDNNENSFYPDIELEINNLNRIHIPVGLPHIIKACGLGKKIYKQLIYELGYISTTILDRTIDSVFVWDSLRKDTEIFTFVKGESVLCISPELDFVKIEELLKKFYIGDCDDIILDDDFRTKYSKEVRKSKFTNSLLDKMIN